MSAAGVPVAGVPVAAGPDADGGVTDEDAGDLEVMAGEEVTGELVELPAEDDADGVLELVQPASSRVRTAAPAILVAKGCLISRSGFWVWEWEGAAGSRARSGGL